MSEENAASAATAKPCLPETIAIPAEFADRICAISEQALSVLQDHLQAIMSATCIDGCWIGDEAAAFDLATVLAVIDGVEEVVDELNGGEYRMAEPEGAVPEAKVSLIDEIKLMNGAEIQLRAGVDQASLQKSIDLLKAERLRWKACRLQELRDGSWDDMDTLRAHRAAVCLQEAASIDGNYEGLNDTVTALADPEASAREKLAKRDAADPDRADLFRLRQVDGTRKVVRVDLRVPYPGDVFQDGEAYSVDNLLSRADILIAKVMLKREIAKIDERLLNDWVIS